MKKFNKFVFLLFVYILLFPPKVYSSVKEKIINNLKETNNLNFDFKQNTNGKIETGNCTLKFPKKIYCLYNNKNKKILVSNGKSLVIKSNNNYNHYPLDKTPLNIILDKKFFINNIKNFDEENKNKKNVNFRFTKNEMKIDIFFDIKNFNLIGWQVLDIYQNLNTTYLTSIIKNQNIEDAIFKIPTQE